MGVHEHNLDERTLVEAAGRLALAQAHLDLVIRLTITTLCSASIPNGLDAMDSSDLRSELASQFRARCKDPQKRRKLRAMLLEYERLGDLRRRLLQAAWRDPQTGATEIEVRFVGEPATADSLSKLAADLVALTKIIDEARQHGFIAEAADEHASPGGIIQRETRANPTALALLRLPQVIPPSASVESHAIALRGQTTLLQPIRSGRLGMITCPNCQTKVVST